MSRLLGALILLLLLAVGAAYALSPIYAFHQLQQAAQTGDRDRLEALVDFPTVREDLRGQTEARATKLAREVGGIGHPIAEAIGKLGQRASDQAVDKLVTPDAIVEVLKTGHAIRHGGSGKAGQKPTIRYGYLTPDRFRVTIAPDKKSVGAVALIMDRRGLFSWRVERIELRALADDDVVKDLY